MIKKTTLLQSNFIEITLRHGCSPVNLLHIFRTLFPKNTSGWLLLNINVLDFENNKMVEEILNQKWLQQEINPLKSHEIKQLLLMISPHKYVRKYSIQGWNHSRVESFKQTYWIVFLLHCPYKQMRMQLKNLMNIMFIRHIMTKNL